MPFEKNEGELFMLCWETKTSKKSDPRLSSTLSPTCKSQLCVAAGVEEGKERQDLKAPPNQKGTDTHLARRSILALAMAVIDICRHRCVSF